MSGTPRREGEPRRWVDQGDGTSLPYISAIADGWNHDVLSQSSFPHLSGTASGREGTAS